MIWGHHHLHLFLPSGWTPEAFYMRPLLVKTSWRCEGVTNATLSVLIEVQACCRDTSTINIQLKLNLISPTCVFFLAQILKMWFLFWFFFFFKKGRSKLLLYIYKSLQITYNLTEKFNVLQVRFRTGFLLAHWVTCDEFYTVSESRSKLSVGGWKIN